MHIQPFLTFLRNRGQVDTTMRRNGKQHKVNGKAAVEIKKGSAKKGAQKLTGDDGYKAMDRSKECRVCFSLCLSLVCSWKICLVPDIFRKKKTQIIAGYIDKLWVF